MLKKLKNINLVTINKKCIIIWQDDSKSHTSKKTISKFADIAYEILSHPSYSETSLQPINIFTVNVKYPKTFGTLEDLQNYIVEFLIFKQSISSNLYFKLRRQMEFY